jgi:hypothetical protein
MDQWLVRTASNVIAGPYSREQLVQLVQEGKLSLQDEICQANHYWIYLHEHQEVLDQLGIHMPRTPRDDDEEVTETQTDASLGGSEGAAPLELNLSPLEEMPEDYDGSTAVFSRASVRDHRPGGGGPPQAPNPSLAPAAEPTSVHAGLHSTMAPATATGLATPAPSTMHRSTTPVSQSTLRPAGPAPAVAGDAQIERPSIWKSFAWLIVFAVLRLLRQPNY